MTSRFWDPSGAFAHPVTVLLLAGAAAIIATAALAILILSRTNKIGPNLTRELQLRTGAWAVMVPAIAIPVLVGPAWTIFAVLALSLLCYQEFARATGLFRERFLSFVVVCSILAIAWSSFDAWYGFFVALFPLGVVAIAVATIPLDRPQHYVQRTSLGVLAFLLFGAGLGHLGYAANDALYRPIILMLVFSVAVSDVAAFCCGKLIGGPKLAPATSPGKTISGALGALAITTLFVIWIAGAIYGSALSLFQRALLGVLVGAGAQLGDLMLSSIKRDLGVKDMGAAIPGHGGVLDRANSLLLVAPAAFHYLHYLVGVGMNAPAGQIAGG